jgi:hypothetical protein
VSGQTRSVTPYDYRLEPTSPDEAGAPPKGDEAPPF